MKACDFSKGERGPVISAKPGKTRITIRLDGDVLDWFLERADKTGGANYQTMINGALREYIEGRSANLESVLRRVIREELHPTS